MATPSLDGTKVVRRVEADCRDHPSGVRAMSGIHSDDQDSERLEFQLQEPSDTIRLTNERRKMPQQLRPLGTSLTLSFLQTRPPDQHP